MKKIIILFLFFIGIACQNEVKKDPEQDAGILPVKVLGTDRQLEEPQRKDPVLVLETNALQLLNEETGSTTDLLFGMEIDQLVDIVNTTIKSEYIGSTINTECGAGPLKMASWDNGLVLVFKENKITLDWEFEGWFMGESFTSKDKLNTISGLGIGSSRKDLEEIYVVEVKNTSLGQEFATENGLFGIISGTGETSRITAMWSGLSCNFR